MTVNRIRVVYPRGVRTGGPEALHQLVDAMRSAGAPAWLSPHPRTLGRKRIEDYRRYDAPELKGPLDQPGDVVIAPEYFLTDLLALRVARGFCWWLSIDNCPWFRTERYFADRSAGVADSPGLRDLRALAIVARRPRSWREDLARLEHLAQSEYARDYLERRAGVRAAALSEFISHEGGVAERANASVRAGDVPRIAFNPAKGARLTRRVQEGLGQEALWEPIAGLSPEAVRERLGRADVYLDLGGHPGKDRLPREAALAGAVTVVARRGAGAYAADVPVPDWHKVAMDGDPVANAVAALRDVLADPVLRAELGAKAQARSVEFSWRQSADAMRSIPACPSCSSTRSRSLCGALSVVVDMSRGMHDSPKLCWKRLGGFEGIRNIGMDWKRLEKGWFFRCTEICRSCVPLDLSRC